MLERTEGREACNCVQKTYTHSGARNKAVFASVGALGTMLIGAPLYIQKSIVSNAEVKFGSRKLLSIIDWRPLIK